VCFRTTKVGTAIFQAVPLSPTERLPSVDLRADEVPADEVPGSVVAVEVIPLDAIAFPDGSGVALEGLVDVDGVSLRLRHCFLLVLWGSSYSPIDKSLPRSSRKSSVKP